MNRPRCCLECGKCGLSESYEDERDDVCYCFEHNMYVYGSVDVCPFGRDNNDEFERVDEKPIIRCENCKFFTPNHVYGMYILGGCILETWCNKFERHVTPSTTYCTFGGEKDE